MKRTVIITLFLTLLTAGLFAQNPVSISQVGTTPVTTTVPVSGTVTANAGSGTLAVSAASLPLPTGASTAAKQPALGTAGTASTDVISVQGIASMTPLLSTVTGSLTNISGTISLPTGASTAANQTNASQKTQIVDGSGNVIASTSNNLNVQCANCSGSGASAADEATFTAGTSVFAPSGGFFQTTATSNALTNGQQGQVQMTASRSFFTNLRNAAGTEVGTSTTPLQVTLANTGANTNKILVTPDSVALPANQSVNVAQLAGTTTDVNSGVKSAGTLRVVLATDQPALTNKLLVTPDSVALPNNQSVNVSQINGVTPLMGNGATGTGAIRVSIANDSTGIVALTTGSAQIGHLEANQSSNTAQINGVTPLMGAGNGGTGSQRVNIATDQLIIPAYLGTSTVSTDAATGCYLQSAGTTNSTSCKGSAGNFYGVRAVNTTATLYYLRLYNSSGAPTCSSATGFIETIPIPASATGAGIMAVLPIPINYGTGIGFCFTGGGSSTDNTNAATGVYLTLYYK